MKKITVKTAMYSIMVLFLASIVSCEKDSETIENDELITAEDPHDNIPISEQEYLNEDELSGLNTNLVKSNTAAAKKSGCWLKVPYKVTLRRKKSTNASSGPVTTIPRQQQYEYYTVTRYRWIRAC